MKNIHIIPTDKPSRLYKNTGTLILDKLSEVSTDGISINQHIYITSDEEPKNGDWCLDIFTKTVFKLGKGLANGQTTLPNATKKIILTTDLDLIADGVQAISDEFLEWFVNNPSCEEVEVIPLRKSSGWYDEKDVWHWDFLAYKIIIPQEEPKQFSLDEDVYENSGMIIPKLPQQEQETLEEAKNLSYFKANAEEDYMRVPISVLRYITELEERMYSEEEMINFAKWSNRKEDKSKADLLKIWFNQFKKK
jgi:hypothetical protein